MSKPYILFAVLCMFIPITILQAKDDDREYLSSIAEQGYEWLAKKEIRRLRASSDEQDRILALYLAAVQYEREGNREKAAEYFDTFIDRSEKCADQAIRAKRKEVLARTGVRNEADLIQYADAIGRLLLAKDPDMKELKKVQHAMRKKGKKIVDDRRETYERLRKENEGKLDPPSDALIKEAQSRLALARSLYYYSFGFKRTEESRRRELLKEALVQHLNDLDFMHGDTVISIPFFSGQCLWELGQYKKAVEMFRHCNRDIFLKPQFDLIRKPAYARITEGYFRTGNYSECVRQAASYLIDFPAKEDKESGIGQTVRLYMAQSLCEMEHEKYAELRDTIGMPQDRHSLARKMLIGIDTENGPCSEEARVFFSEKYGGWIGSILKGIRSCREKDYRKSVSLITRGLKQAVSERNISEHQRLAQEARARYFLGLSYYRMDMLLPAAVSFRGGALTCKKIYTEKNGGIGPEEKRWFLENIKSWQTAAGKYYKRTHSRLALEKYRKALAFYRDIRRSEGMPAGEEENINIMFAKILAQDSRYGEACTELDAIPCDSSVYPESLRLKGKYTWNLYIEQGKKDPELCKEALEYLNASRGLLLKAGPGKEEDIQRRIGDIDALVVLINYTQKEYSRLIQGIDDFWKNPPLNRKTRLAAGRYQISACTLAEADMADRKSAAGRLRNLAKGCALLERVQGEYRENRYAEDINGLRGKLGSAYVNILRRRGILSEEEKKMCREKAGELLHGFAVNASGPDAAQHVIAVSDILFEEIGNYKLAEDITAKAVFLLTEKTKGRYPPYDKSTKEKLERSRDRFFDRHEARGRWDRFVDRMYDGKDANGEKLSRKAFLAAARDRWPEKPYLYEKAYIWMSEALMFELGYAEEKRAELAAGRDSDRREEIDAFWEHLFSSYRERLLKDPGLCREIRGFLEDMMEKHRYQERLADCYFRNGKYRKALKVYSKLDEYYLHDIGIKSKTGRTYLNMARAEKDPAAQKKYADRARQEFIWIKQNSPVHAKEGRIEYYRAVFSIADCYAVTDRAAARRYLIEVDAHSPVTYPDRTYREKLLKQAEEFSD